MLRYYQKMYEVELLQLDKKGKYYKNIESFFSEDLEECQKLLSEYKLQNLPAQLKQVYVEVDEQGLVIDVEDLLNVMDKTF